MAEPDPLLDEYQDEKDRETEVALDNPAASVGSPVPDDLDEIAPASPVAPAPPPAIDLTDPAASVAPMPGAAPAVPGAPPAVPGAAPDVNARAATAVDISNRQGAVDVEKANTQTGTAQRMADAALEADDDARLEHADYLKRRQDAESDLDRRVKAYESAKLEDPRKKGNGLRATLSVIFGGLGAAFRSAGGGDAANQSLALLQKRWDDDTELQKANIAALKDGAVMARTRLSDVDEGRRRMQRDADARLVSKYNLALKQGEAQLRGQGVPQAQIDADARILKLREGQATAAARARKDEDEHALAQARAAALLARAGRDARKGKGGGGSGGGLSAFVSAANKLGPGEQITPEVAQLGLRAGLKPNQIAAEVDRYRNSDDKSNKAGAGGIGSVRQNAVLGNLAEAEKAAKDIGPVSAESIEQLRRNENTTERAKGHGVVGAITQGLQAVHLAARGRYEGIPADEQQKITAAEQVITHLTEMQQGKNLETLEQYRERYSPYVPGLNEAEVRRREAALPGLVAEQRAVQDPNGVGTKRQEAAEHKGGAPVDAERMRKAKAALNNPNAPAEVRKQAAAFLKQAIKSAGKKAPANNGGEPLDDIAL